MNSRLLWTIAGTCLCLSLGGCGKDAGTAMAAAATATPEEWSCDLKAEKDPQCKIMKIRNPLPSGKDLKIIHLAGDAKFRIEYDSGIYRLVPKSPEWAAPLVRAQLQWKAPTSQLLEDDDCVLKAALKTADAKAAALVGDPTVNPHFYSGDLEIHNVNNDHTKVAKHILYIYPIANSRSYCLEFDEVGSRGGGRHDGAVHGDP